MSDRMKLGVERVPDAGVAVGGHCYTDKNGNERGFPCDQQVTAILFKVAINDDWYSVMLTRDECSDLSRALAEVLCDG